ncbi:ABC transporter substrate-binding protein [Pengzhenrongella sp.]|jgi:raffinose/stachyose/melibiose transport system substrate-binding protein|uniref:ABC transporter substrate-binding protein n=1 Tax=Pengzhenrongella sp. TaxID=2888820 RepID=UPI002F935EBC
MRIRRTVAALAVVCSAVALTACSGSPSQPGAGKDTTLSFFSWDNEKTMKPIIAGFEKDNPNIKVKFSNAPPVAEYISTLQTRVLSGTAADVFSIAAENKTNLIGGKLVVDLTNETFMSGITDFNKAAYSADDHVYGMSTSTWGAGVLYNKDLLAKVGVKAPPKTWDEFLALCKTLKAAKITPYLESVQGMSTPLSAFLGAENAAGGGKMDTGIFDGSSSFADTWVEPLTQWSKLWKDGLVTKDVVGLTGDQVRDEFANGRVAMIVAGPWDVQPVRDANPKLNFEMVPVPALADGAPYLAGAASPGWAINAKTKNLTAAKSFLTYLASAKVVEEYHDATSAITTTAEFTPKIDPALEPIAKAVRAGDVYLPQIAWKRHEDVLNVEAVAQLQLLVQGKATPTQVAEDLDRKLKETDG